MVQNYNLGGDDETLRRQQALADMLRQQSMTPLPAASYRVSPLEGLAKMLQAYSARKWDEVNDQTRQANTQRNQADMSQFAKLLRGAPAVNPLTPNDDEGNPMPQVSPAQEPDLAGAMEFAMQSKSPQLQALSQQLLGAQISSAMPKTPKWEKFERPNVDGTSDVGFVDVNNPNPIRTFQRGGTSPVKGVAVNGQMVNPVSGQPFGKEIPKQIAPDSLVTMGPGGQLLPNQPVIDAKAQIARAGRSQTNVNLPPAERAFDVETAKLDAKQLDEFRDNAMKANSGLARISEMKRLSQEGVFSGTMAEGRTGVANLFNTLGVPVDQKKLSNSQEYLKHAKELTLSLLKEGVGASQISNADLKFVNDTVPQLENSPEARKNLIDYIERRLQSSVDRFQRADQYARKNRTLGGFTYKQDDVRVVDW